MAAAVGRPTKYKQRYCSELLKSARRDETVYRFCADIGIHVDTYYAWKGKFHEFSEAAKEADTIRKANFLDKARNCAFKPDTNACNNGMAYLLAHNLGLDVKPPEKPAADLNGDLATAIKEIVGKLPG